MDGLISRQAVLETQAKYAEYIGATKFWQMRDDIRALPSVTPKPKTDVLDKIRAEIAMYEADCRLQGGTDECEKCNSNVFGSIYRIIDKYKIENEE